VTPPSVIPSATEHICALKLLAVTGIDSPFTVMFFSGCLYESWSYSGLEYLHCHLQRHPLSHPPQPIKMAHSRCCPYWGRQPIHCDGFLKRSPSKSKLVFVTTPETSQTLTHEGPLEESCHHRQLKNLHRHLRRHRPSHILQPTKMGHSSHHRTRQRIHGDDYLNCSPTKVTVWPRPHL